MTKLTLAFWFFVTLSGQAYAVNKCTDSNGKVTYQEMWCDSSSSQSGLKVWNSGTGTESPAKDSGSESHEKDSVTLQEATLFISKSFSPNNTFNTTFTLDTKWKNNTKTMVKIIYQPHFFDSSKTKIGSGFRKGTDVAPNWVSSPSASVGYYYGDSRDKFDYKKVSSVVVTYEYKIDSDKFERNFTKVTVRGAKPTPPEFPSNRFLGVPPMMRQ